MNKNDLTAEEALKQATEEFGIFESMPTIIKEDDEFQFECQQCGACCISRNDIILNAFDIYNAASYLDINCNEFINKYTRKTLGGSSKIPMIILKMDDKTDSCPFLKFDYMHDCKFKCTIHEAKPGACQCHPLGIMSECDIDNNGDVKSSSFNFIKVGQCSQSKTGNNNKVKDWMKNYLDHKEETTKAHQLSIMTNFIVNWRKLYVMIGILELAAELKGFDSSNDLIAHSYNLIANLFVERCYTAYDTKEPFLEQCEENYEFIKERFNMFAETVVPFVESTFNESCGMTIDELLEDAKSNKDYKNDKGEIMLEKIIYDVGTNVCTYSGIPADSKGDENINDE